MSNILPKIFAREGNATTTTKREIHASFIPFPCARYSDLAALFFVHNRASRNRRLWLLGMDVGRVGRLDL